MKHRHGIVASTNVRIEIRDALSGKRLKIIERHNLIVNAGLNLLRDFMNRASPDAVGYFGLGKGTTSVSLTDTDLQTPIARYAITIATTGPQSLTFEYDLDASTANGNTLTEAGLFTAASSGTMYARVVFPGIVKTAGVVFIFIWELTWENTP